MPEGKETRKDEFFIVAGETSGEQYGALLAAELRKLRPGCAVTGVGGDAMKEEGVDLLHHVKDLAVVGLTDVLARIDAERDINEHLLGTEALIHLDKIDHTEKSRMSKACHTGSVVEG